MSRGRTEHDGHRLIDQLSSAPELGSLCGVLATSYDVTPDFFELDFLPSLFGLRASDDRRWASRVALERMLAHTDAVTVLMDGRRFQGRPRSLRVELVPSIGPHGQVLHAKVLLLVYEGAVRLLVASANLTEPGYRLNREVALVLTATKKRPIEGSLIRAAIEPMSELLGGWWTDGAERVARAALEQLATWGTPEPSDDEAFVWGGGEAPLWRAFLDRWPASEVVHAMTIVSPFWSEEHGDGPVARLLDELSQRRLLGAHAELLLMTDAAPETRRSYRPLLPASFASFDGRRWNVHASAVAVDPRVAPEELGGRDDVLRERALHAKVVVLRGPRTTLAYVGSANFSAHGWGFLPSGRRANLEAGVVLRRTGKSRMVLDALVPRAAGAPVVLTGAVAAKLAVPQPDHATMLWPTFVKAVRLVPEPFDPARLGLLVETYPDRVEGPFSAVLPPGDGAPVVAVHSLPDPGQHRCPLDAEAVRALLQKQTVAIAWWGSQTAVEFPINVTLDARDQLPFGHGEHRPGEGLLLAYYQDRIAWEELFPDDNDPAGSPSEVSDAPLASGVDTSRIQSYQVRGFVEALRGIRDDLRESMTSEAAMRMALLGPVSPVSLAREVAAAIRAGARSAVAGGFQLVELLACLGEAREFVVDKRLEDAWGAMVERASSEIGRLLTELRCAEPAILAHASFAAYERAVRKQYGIDEGVG